MTSAPRTAPPASVSGESPAGAGGAVVVEVEVDGVAMLLIDVPAPSPNRAGLRDLTDAERAVALCVAKGMSNAAIADARGTHVRTVANQVASLFRKLGVASRAELRAQLAGHNR